MLTKDEENRLTDLTNKAAITGGMLVRPELDEYNALVEKQGQETPTAPDMIDRLLPGQVIVIGSNVHGKHAAGAARYAHEHFGLRWGVGEGLSGQAYALPTMEGPAALRAAVFRFLAYAELSHDLTFLLTKVGCGIAGYKEEEVAWLFATAPVNVLRPAGWPSFDASRGVKPS